MNRDAAASIAQAGIDSVNPVRMIAERLSLRGSHLVVDAGPGAGAPVDVDLSVFRRVVVLGAGKAGAAMARGLEDILGDRIDDLGQLLRQAPWPLPVLAAVWDLTVNMSNFGVLAGYMIVTGDALTPLPEIAVGIVEVLLCKAIT